ncbi:MAG: cation transporter dimerization domain-containing protein, partial [Candidatus Helarchaeota archaeon]
AKEKLFDNLLSSSVLISFIGALFEFYILDSIIGLLIALFIIKGGLSIFLNSTKTLLDAVIDFENKKELYELIESYPRVNAIEHFEIRSYGKYLFLEADISLNQDIPLSKIEKLKRKLTENIKSKFPNIFKVIIITQARPVKKIKIAMPVSENNGLKSEIASHFGEAPYFAFLELQEGEISKLEIQSNKYAKLEKRKGIKISDWLCSEKIDKLYLRKELQRGPLVIFENSLIEVNITDLNTLEEIYEKEKEKLKETP